MKNIYEKYSKGREAEKHYLGYGPKVDDLLIKDNIDPTQLSYKNLRKEFISHYPLNPEMPQKKWSNDLFDLVANKLNLDPENPKGLSFYNCLGTNLDERGTDCFFVFKNLQNNRQGVFELDITIRPDKDEHRSDQVLVVNVENFPDPHRDENSYIFALEEIAEKIAVKLLHDTETIH